jgi:hypothetical protein
MRAGKASSMSTAGEPPRRPDRAWRHRVLDIGLVAIGVSAPIGLLAVNGAAFIVQHLGEFRLGIAIAAVASGLALSGLTANTVLGRVAVYMPKLYRRYRRLMVAAAAVSVVAWSLFGGWGAYQSMADARNLPNPLATLTAVWLLLLPVLMTFISKRLRARSRAVTSAEER